MLNLSNQEHLWLELMLSRDFQGRAEIIKQIKSASIIREYTRGYLSMKFYVDKSLEPADVAERIPVEMYACTEGKSPLVFLLHVINGYIDELEIYYAGLEEISSDIDITDAKLELVTH